MLHVPSLIGSNAVRAGGGRLPQLPGEAGFLQESHSQLRRGGQTVWGLLLRQVPGVALHRRVRGGALLLRVSICRQGGSCHLRPMDDFLLGRFCRGEQGHQRPQRATVHIL